MGGDNSEAESGPGRVIPLPADGSINSPGIIPGGCKGAESEAMASVVERTPKAALVERMKTAGIIAIMRHTAPALARQTVAALSAGGVQVIEVTMNSAGAADMLQELAGAYRDDVLLGAGTVLTVFQCRASVERRGALHRRTEYGPARHRVLPPARHSRRARRVDAD